LADWRQEGKEMNITPQWITELKPNEIFVFGSNEAGRHGAGAAKMAIKWGAIYGEAFGLRGQTFAIPTVNADISDKLSLDRIGSYVDSFIRVTQTYSGLSTEGLALKWFVTEIGCGLAGWTPKDIAPLFKEAIGKSNIWLPEYFWEVLNGR
jgi:hypothetical protein